MGPTIPHPGRRRRSIPALRRRNIITYLLGDGLRSCSEDSGWGSMSPNKTAFFCFLLLMTVLLTGCASSKAGQITLSPFDSYELTADKMRQFGEGLGYADICRKSSSQDIRRLSAWINKHHPQRTEELLGILIDSTVDSIAEIMSLAEESFAAGRPDPDGPGLKDICREKMAWYDRLEIPRP